MRNVFHSVIFGALICALSLTGCTNKQPEPQANKSLSPTTPSSSSSTKTTATGTLSAKPNPIQVCDGSGSGVTTITWTSNGAKNVEVRVGKPDGDVFAQAAPSGSWTTAKWVGDGMVFFLQDVSDGKPLTANNTIATLTMKVTNEGCK